MSNSETSSNYEDNAIRKVDKYQIIYTARQAYKISFAFAVLELNVDKAEKHRENNSLVRSDIFSELNSRIQNILSDSDPISKYLSPSLNYLDYGMCTLTKYEWHSLRDSAHRGIKKTVRSQEEFFKYKKKIVEPEQHDFDFSALSDFLEIASTYREELTSLKLKAFQPMLASTLNQCSHLINTDEKIVCKNLQLLFAVERLLIEHEKQIQDRINELSNEEDRKAKYALMHDCYVHYQFFDRKLTIRRELYLEYLFHSVKQHVKQAEAVVQSLEDYIQSLEDYTQSEEDYTVEKLDLRFLTTILMIVRRVDVVLLDRIEDLRIVEEQNKDEPFYYRAKNSRDLRYRINETLKLKCRLFQIFSKGRTNAIYAEEVLQQKALLESILLEVQSLMAKSEAKLNALDEGMDQLPVIEMVRQILRLDPSVHERLQPKKLDADMNQFSDP